jgi:RNA polymerase sigma-70 factor (sigma-E family)
LVVAATEADFDGFVVAHYARLVRAAYLVGPDAGQAEDLVQAALMRTYSHWGSQRDPDAAWSYTYTTLIRLASRSARRRWWGERPAATLPEQATRDPYASWDDADAVRSALAKLPTDQRLVLVLRYYLDLSEAEAAAALNCAVGTVKSRRNRALAALRADGVLSMSVEETADG